MFPCRECGQWACTCKTSAFKRNIPDLVDFEAGMDTEDAQEALRRWKAYERLHKDREVLLKALRNVAQASVWSAISTVTAMMHIHDLREMARSAIASVEEKIP